MKKPSKKLVKKLSLNAETVRRIDDKTLDGVVGAPGYIRSNGCGGNTAWPLC